MNEINQKSADKIEIYPTLQDVSLISNLFSIEFKSQYFRL